jgi:hypothetical protein
MTIGLIALFSTYLFLSLISIPFLVYSTNYLVTPSAEQEKYLFECIHIILGDLIIDLNGEFQDKGGEKFDFKQVYKSPKLSRI